jgi:hypothetical protein
MELGMDHHRPSLTRFATLALALTSAAAAQTTWYVDAGAPAPGLGTAAAPFVSIQFALDQPSTVAGDTVLVLPGVYLEALDLRGKALELRSTDGPTVTRIDPQNLAPGLIVEGLGEAAARLQGFTITNGSPNTTSPAEAGGVLVSGSTLHVEDCVLDACGHGPWANALAGGIHAEDASLTLVGCALRAGTGEYAGALRAVSSTVTLDGCTFVDNQCDNNTIAAAGVLCEASIVIVDRCTFTQNQALYVSAGGLYLRDCDTALRTTSFMLNSANDGPGSLRIEGGTASIEDCLVRAGSTYGSGGNLGFHDASLTVVRTDFRDGSAGNTNDRGGNVFQQGGVSQFHGCTFTDGFAGLCGGLAVHSGVAQVEECTFEGNRASYGPQRLASALLVEGTGQALVQRTTFRTNDARTFGIVTSAATIDGDVTLRNCTVTGNVHEPGMAAVRGAALEHCIVWGNGGAALDSASGAVWSDIEGGQSGVGNFASDPLLGPSGALLAGSPCIDAGDPALAADPDGSPRDVGAARWSWPSIGQTTCSALPNSAGTVGECELFGAAVVGAPTLYARAAALPAHSLAMFVVSTGAGSIPLGGGGVGTLCLASPFVRFQSLARPTDGSGVVSIAVDVAALPLGPAVVVGSGTELHFQAWYRDTSPAGAATSRVSTAAAVTFQ